jgi:hypothetical protein
MKQTILLFMTLLASFVLSAQSLTPTVIATAGFGYASPELQVDITIGETFITTLQTPDVILTQGFHQPVAQQGGGCINVALIDPDFICPLIFDPVCGCDGVTYANSCVAETTAGVTSWTPGECGAAIPGCLSPQACNYNPAATEDDGSCLFVGLPCDDGDPATVDFVASDCTCQGEISGCTNPDACNYNPIATLDDFSCVGAGGACNDGNENTVDDYYTNDCVCVGLLLGCIDVAACNYNPAASAEDGSCFYVGDICDDNDLGTDNDLVGNDCVCAGEPNGQVPGCTAVEACNYNEIATIDDGSCILPGEPCDDGNPLTAFDQLGVDCVCTGMLMGCTDLNACNYLEGAVVDDGSCYFPGDLCDDGNAETQNDSWSVDCVCSGEIVGCTAMSACNYNPAATVGDFSCVFMGDLCDDGVPETINDVYGFDCLCMGEVVFVPGCTEPNACNYDMSATTDDGSCFFIGDACDDGLTETSGDMIDADCMCVGEVVMTMGCTNPDACNYDASAGADDGSCFFVGDSCDDGDVNTTDDVYNANCECEGTVGVQELEANIQLFPNPATTEVIVTIDGAAPTEVTIFDATGRFVMSAQRTSRIDIQSLAAGVYTLRVVNGGVNYNGRVVKQ